MGQSIGTRIEVLGTLTCLGPVHVGGWDNTAEANLTVARDGTGRPCLPGTSIAGALRAYLANVAPFRGPRSGPLTNAVFGHIIDGDRGGSPSWVRVDDAHLIGAEVTPAVRDGVGIDRRSASAAANFLYTRQVLPAGTGFALRLVADTPTTTDDAQGYPGGWPALLADAVDAMVAGLLHGRVPIGAGRGRGFGRVKLSDVTIRRADLSAPAGLVAWLTGAAHAEPVRRAEANPPDGRLRVTVGWRPVGPLLVRDSVAGTVVDTLPLTATAADGTVRLLLPGSSIRGAVRAHAERIVRTLRGEDAPATLDEALRQPPPGVDVLFGAAPTGRRADQHGARRGPDGTGRGPDGTEQGPDAGRGPDGTGKGWRGVLSVADCHSVGRVHAERWNEIVTTSPATTRASDGPPRPGPGKRPPEEREERADRNAERDKVRHTLREQLAGIHDSFALGVSDHVAIDRWTGGAGDHRLFSVLDPADTVAWEPIHVEVDVTRLDRREPADAVVSARLALPLLLLVLRDLRDGWLSLGYGGTRGRGQIEVTDVTFDGEGLSEGLNGPWRSLAGKTLDDILADPPREIVEAMTGWVNAFQEAAA